MIGLTVKILVHDQIGIFNHRDRFYNSNYGRMSKSGDLRPPGQCSLVQKNYH